MANINKEEKSNYKVGDYYQITLSDGKENSTAYFQIVNGTKNKEELYLKSYSSAKYKSNGYKEQKINAQNLHGMNVKKLSSIESIKKRLYQMYKKDNHINDQWYEENIKIDIKDMTAQIVKEKEFAKKQIASKKSAESKTEISNIPLDVQEVYKTKYNKNLSTQEYTKNIFEMSKDIYNLAESERNINQYEVVAFMPLFRNYEKKGNTTEGFTKSFNDFISNPNNKDNLEIIGTLYKKSLNDNFLGFKKEHEPNIEYEKDKIIKSIENGTFPLMNKKDSIDYIYNPDTNSIYRGSNQIGLQTNNNLNGINAQSYVALDSFIKQNGVLNKKLKTCSQIIAKGRNSEGNYIFEVVVPCKISAREKKAVKAAAKEEKRRNIKDAKYKYKFGELPIYHTKLQLIPEQQPPITAKENLISDEVKLMENSSIEKRLEVDSARYFAAMLTKSAYEPATDWNNPQWKMALLNFATEHPEKMIKLENESYKHIADKVNNLSNENINTNQNQDVAEKSTENTNKNNKGRTR